MGKWIFAGIVVGIVLAVLIIYFRIKRKVSDITTAAFGTDDLSEIMNNISNDMDDKPKSLSGCDSIIRPLILKDFPDYDFTMGETYVKEHLEEVLKDKPALKIHNVVIRNYERSSTQKTIIYQASLEYREDGRLIQKRYEMHYSYIIPRGDAATVATNCPNCGGALKYGETSCPFCGSRVVNILGNCWEFTETYEK